MRAKPDMNQGQLELQPVIATAEVLSPLAGQPCALEDEAFPFEEISEVAEVESWRKELNRPIYHIHKWWAQRLGTVFRAIVLGVFTPAGTDLLAAFYRPVRIREATVFDPFMGSGTTVGEALKLGMCAIGRDINPVAHFLVRNALALHKRTAVLETFNSIERDVASDMKALYKTRLAAGIEADVLYYFWVKQVTCPECSGRVDLFSSRIFAKHASPRCHPQARAVCPGCGEVNATRYDAEETVCNSCALSYNPQHGAARGQNATCPNCKHSFPIARTIRQGNAPPAHRLYAKLVLTPAGKKVYLAATADDLVRYKEAERALNRHATAYPIVVLNRVITRIRYLATITSTGIRCLMPDSCFVCQFWLTGFGQFPTRPCASFLPACFPGCWSLTTCLLPIKVRAPVRCGICSRITY